MRFFRRLQRKLPKKHEIQKQANLNIFKAFWKRPELWAMNRNSIPTGIAAGIFSAFLPMPFEMVVAIFLGIVFGGNLIFATTLVWISNPLTWVPLWTPCYLLGAKILDLTPISLLQIKTLELSIELAYHYVALWLGCLIVGTILAFSSYFLVRILWVRQVRSEWLERKAKQKCKFSANK